MDLGNGFGADNREVAFQFADLGGLIANKLFIQFFSVNGFLQIPARGAHFFLQRTGFLARGIHGLTHGGSLLFT